MDYGKLIKLLNEYEKTLEPNLQIEWTENGVKATPLTIISKQYGFIKWLVENDKIDREKFGNSETKSSKYSDFELSYDTPREDYTNILLMELSISDTPIEDLLLYLK